jgi:hypothetical protein
VLLSLIYLLYEDQELMLEAILVDEAVKIGNAHFADSASVCLVQKGLRPVMAADSMSSVMVKEIQCQEDCEVSRTRKTSVQLFYMKNKTLVLDVPLHPCPWVWKPLPKHSMEEEPSHLGQEQQHAFVTVTRLQDSLTSSHQ